MQLLAFDVWGDYAHFKKRYATSSPLTHSIPSKPTILGLIAAILGFRRNEYQSKFKEYDSKIALQILNPIKKTRISINQIDEDPKSALQEWAQSQGFLSPTYELVSETGPDHAKHFFMSVTINGEKWGEGSGSSKQSAEKEAAIQVLRKLKLME